MQYTGNWQKIIRHVYCFRNNPTAGFLLGGTIVKTTLQHTIGIALAAMAAVMTLNTGTGCGQESTTDERNRTILRVRGLLPDTLDLETATVTCNPSTAGPTVCTLTDGATTCTTTFDVNEVTTDLFCQFTEAPNAWYHCVRPAHAIDRFVCTWSHAQTCGGVYSLEGEFFGYYCDESLDEFLNGDAPFVWFEMCGTADFSCDPPDPMPEEVRLCETSTSGTPVEDIGIACATPDDRCQVRTGTAACERILLCANTNPMASGCTPEPVDLCANVTCPATEACMVGVCNPANGACEVITASDGTACDDGDACTQSDTCSAGVCVGTNPVVCDGEDQCRETGSCDPVEGTCIYPPKPDGTTCDDGDICTPSDTCELGVCTGHDHLVARLSGDQIFVPPFNNPAGNPNAYGWIKMRLVMAPLMICWELDVEGMAGTIGAPGTTSHIHQAPPGFYGVDRVTMFVAESPPERCMSGNTSNRLDHSVMAEFRRNPAAFFYNIHSSQYPAPNGEVRGQLNSRYLCEDPELPAACMASGLCVE